MPSLAFKAEIMDEAAMKRALRRISHEIIEHNDGTDDVCLIGIQRRGVSLARMIRDEIERFEQVSLPLGLLDITFYRDDLSLRSEQPVVHHTDIPFSVEKMRVVMIDDVLFSGRTARAAMDAICARGRPAQIQLAVLIDRGHRELPIRADYVGKNVPTRKSEMIGVSVWEFDEKMGVDLYEAIPD